MSFYWQPACFTCEEEGPAIRAGHSGITFVDGDKHTTDTTIFYRWLNEHEYHDVRLLGEMTTPWREDNDATGRR